MRPAAGSAGLIIPIPLLWLDAAAVLAAVLVVEVTAPGETMERPAVRLAAQQAPARPQSGDANAPDSDALAELADRLIERPLFSPDRRLAAAKVEAAAALASIADGLPRLSGVIVAPNTRYAIFAGADGRPVRAQEGGSIGRFKVRTIEAGRVTVTGTEGEQVLRPTFAKTTEQRAPGAGKPAQ